MLLWFLKIISSGLYLHKSFGTASQKLRLIDTFERDCRCEWSSWILAPDGFYPQQSLWQMDRKHPKDRARCAFIDCIYNYFWQLRSLNFDTSSNRKLHWTGFTIILLTSCGNRQNSKTHLGLFALTNILSALIMSSMCIHGISHLVLEFPQSE